MEAVMMKNRIKAGTCKPMILHIGISDNLRQKQLANFEECRPEEHQFLIWKLSQPIKDGINVVLFVKLAIFQNQTNLQT